MTNDESPEERLLLSFLGYSEDLDTLVKISQHYQRKIETLEKELVRYEARPKTLIQILLLFGVIALISSVITYSYILAFVGLGLTFWGGLLHFTFMKPAEYVNKKLLDSTTISPLLSIDKMITDLNFRGKATYFKSKETRDILAFIPVNKLSVSEKLKDFPKNLKGLYLIPPGLDLANLLEKELGVDFSRKTLDYVLNNLPKLLIEDLEIVKEIEMSNTDNIVHVKMTNPVYQDVCNKINKSNICSGLGCPLCSSLACMITKITGKSVTIDTMFYHPGIVEAWYRII